MTRNENFIKELQQAVTKGDIPFILDCMAEDVEWGMIGGNTSRGKANIEKEMASMNDFEMIENKVDRIITHGKLAAANGTFRIKEKGVEKAYGFCDIYEFNSFKNGKIKKMTSYVVPLEKK